jgi:hypothetical protein
MSAMRAWIALLALAATGCSGFMLGCSEPGPPPAPLADAAATGTPHGDHSPQHGGVVMMKGDIHYEVVLDPAGRYRVYFSDASRGELPASTASRVSITITQPGEAPEGVSLAVDEAGESWTGGGKPVKDLSKTTARVSFTLRGEEPYWIDLPFDVKPTRTEAHQ